jgi:hypothetical protein
MRNTGECIRLRVAFGEEDQGRGDNQYQHQHRDDTNQSPALGIENRFQTFDRRAIGREPQHPYQPESPQHDQFVVDARKQRQQRDQVEQIGRRGHITKTPPEWMTATAIALAAAIENPHPECELDRE